MFFIFERFVNFFYFLNEGFYFSVERKKEALSNFLTE